MQISEQQIKLACQKFKEMSGITIYTPDEGTLDDFEQARYDGIVAALEAALSAAEPSVAVKADPMRKEFGASARALRLLAANGPDDDLRDGMRELSNRMFRVLNGLSPSALTAQVQDVAGWRMPVGSKRALVDELKKARSEFMLSDFEIAERIIAAIESLAPAPAKQEG
jgi:hypothetical protein